MYTGPVTRSTNKQKPTSRNKHFDMTPFELGLVVKM